MTPRHDYICLIPVFYTTLAFCFLGLISRMTLNHSGFVKQELEALAVEREVEREQAELLARALRAELAEVRAGLDCASTGELALLHAHTSSEEAVYWDAADAGCEGERDGSGRLGDARMQHSSEEDDAAGWAAAHGSPGCQPGEDGGAPQVVQLRCRKELVAWQLTDVASETGHDDGSGLPDDDQHGCPEEAATDVDLAEAASERWQQEDVSSGEDAHAPHVEDVEETADLEATDAASGGMQSAAAGNMTQADVEPEVPTGGSADGEATSVHGERAQREATAQQADVHALPLMGVQDASPPEHHQVAALRTASSASLQMPPRVQSQLETLRCSFALPHTLPMPDSCSLILCIHQEISLCMHVL